MKNHGLIKKALSVPVSAALMLVFITNSHAALVDVTVTIENLAPTNTISFAPLRLGFHNGTFDAFDDGSAASDAIVSIAEGGSGVDWFEAFAAAEPDAVLGTVADGGPAVPNGNAGIGNMFSSTASSTFRVDTSENAFFTFANMVVPSNDLFLGNDSPIQLFDASGNLLVSQIFQTAANIWDANSEVADPAAAAFVVGGVNGDRTEENGLIAFDFSELGVFDGLTTAAAYDFDFSALARDTAIYSIRFDAQSVMVSAPTAFTLMCITALGLLIRRMNKH
uniref:spondin domain-containing protein n=1 Tax=Ningiella ruwaisensis TaxID=2364274 RepID=UPI00109F8232|nr:spondin domain-containing protein [Ningiella ruwaisensis]